LLKLWKEVINDNQIEIKENTKVGEIKKDGNNFIVVTEQGENFSTHKVLLSIGRRGSPRKLNVEGEELEKVAYRLLEPELISDKNILVVGGGDSAIENALLLAPNNKVTLSYRSENFNRLKPKNEAKIKSAIEKNLLRMEFNTTVGLIREKEVVLEREKSDLVISNDLVYIFAGGELPTQFLEKSGILISKRFGYTLKSHNN
jgi:thioredoxin reductase